MHEPACKNQNTPVLVLCINDCASVLQISTQNNYKVWKGSCHLFELHRLRRLFGRTRILSVWSLRRYGVSSLGWILGMMKVPKGGISSN